MPEPEFSQTEPALPLARGTWSCPNCSCDVPTRFCPGCGERSLRPHDLTLRSLARQLLRTFVKIDGRVVNSCRVLVTRPGALTLAYQNGQRKPYLKPVQLFILLNVLFFAIQSLTELHIFSTLLEAQISSEMWSDLARLLVDRHLAATGQTLADYAPIYDKAVAINAKSLIGLMVLPFALCLSLVFLRKATPFAVQVVFSLHFYAFLLLLFSVPALLAAIEAVFGGSMMLSQLADDILSVVLLTTCVVYLYLAVGKVYGSRGYWRGIQVSLLTVAMVVVFFAYRFILLPITLYTT
jgi:Protein of unknown function (DUF3667)